MAHRTCSEPNCSFRHYGRGLCEKHWQRQYVASKRPPKPPRPPRYLPDENGCWIWQGIINNMGYGMAQTGVKNRRRGAHRVVYEEHRGPIPEGLVLDHLCRNPPCVNPAHLEPVTMRENNRRGRGWSGRNGNKTHCKRGHEFTPENTWIRPSGMRNCRACRPIYSRRQRRIMATPVTETQKRPEVLALVGALAVTNEAPEERSGPTYGDWAESIVHRLEERGYRLVKADSA